MKDPLSDFMKNAQGLSKNPLSIIALFISLIYGLACLVLGLTGCKLNNGQTWVLLLFLVVFPLLVLWSFVYLVCKHHQKLYGPKDFHHDESFWYSLTQEKQAQKLSKVTESSAFEGTGNFDENSGVNLRKSYLLAVELALRQLEIELKTNIKRQAAYHGPNNTIIEFDGFFSQKDSLCGIDIKYIVDINALSGIMESLITIAAKIKSLNDPDFVLIIVMVYEKNKKEIEEQINAFINKFNFNLKLYFYEFDRLLKRFGVI